jgi:hypothetical protein
MGILGHAWDIATSFLPAGNIINKLGRSIGKTVYDSGILGKAARNAVKSVVPEKMRNNINDIADKVTEMLPEGKVKNAIQSVSNVIREPKTNEYRSSKTNIAPGTTVYGEFTKRNIDKHIRSPEQVTYQPDRPIQVKRRNRRKRGPGNSSFY